MRYHLIPVRMAIINKSTNNQCWWGCGEKWTLLLCWWECRYVQPLWKAVKTYLKKLKWICLLTQLSHLWENIQNNPNTNSKEHKHPYIHCRIIYNHQAMEATQVSISRWVDKTTVGHLHNGILCRYKKRKFYPSWEHERPREHYAKWNRLVRERKIPYDFTHTWNQINKLN